MRELRCLLGILIVLSLAGCGGGGGGAGTGAGSAQGVQVPVSSEPPSTEFIRGVFPDSSDYKNWCEVPRSGIDPSTGLAFADKSGSVLLENFWLRSWSNELYLWYSEIVDSDPSLYPDTELYFDDLKTLAVTPSGNAKDNFHFTIDTEDWLAQSQSGLSVGYGMYFDFFAMVTPRPIIVKYVEPDSPAEAAGIERGTIILEVDGQDAVNGESEEIIDALIAGLYPQEDGETHTFKVANSGSFFVSDISLTSQQVVANPVPFYSEINTGTGTVGYLPFHSHIATAEESLFLAFQTFEDAAISDLVLDLRYNSGGLLAMASQVAFMIAGSSETQNKIFETQAFNDKHTVTNPITGDAITPLPFIDESIGPSLSEGMNLPSVNLRRVFVLTTPQTCSASESIINGLRGINVEVVLIGTTTCGKPYGFYPEDNCGTTYFTIQFKGENELGFGDYTDGFSPQNTPIIPGTLVPGCFVLDDFSKALGNTDEALLAAALEYRNSMTCPALPLIGPIISSSSLPLGSDYGVGFAPASSPNALMLQNKIMGLP